MKMIGENDELVSDISSFEETEFSNVATDGIYEKNSQRKPKHKSCRGRLSSENLLLILTISGVVAGFLLGFAIRTATPSEDAITLILFPGEIFMRLLKMILVPIVITSVITGLVSMDLKSGGRLGLHAMTYYLTTTIMAVILGIILVTTIRPGSYGANKHTNTTEQGSHALGLDTYLDIARNIFPENLITVCFESTRKKINREIVFIDNIHDDAKNTSAANSTKVKITKTTEYVRSTNVLGLIAFCIFFGVTLASLGEDGKPVSRMFAIFNNIFMKMMSIIIWYSPVGICSLIAEKVLRMSSFEEVGRSLGMFTVTVMTGLAIHSFIILPMLYWIITRKNAFKIVYGIIQALLTAFGTSSSMATLPVTMRCLENNLGIDKRVTSFMLPIGATINMDGGGLGYSIAAITIAQMYNIPLTFGQVVMISLVVTLASVGAAGVPGSGMVSLLLVVESVGLPVEGVAIFWSIEWLLARFRTQVNVYGDTIGAGIVYHLNKEHLEKTKMETQNQVNDKNQLMDDLL